MDQKNTPNDTEYISQCFDLLNERWHTLDKTRVATSNTFDKYLLTFSTGSLYLSILFTNNLTKNNPLLIKWLLGLGWSVLLLSIIFALLSIYLSTFAHKKQMAIIKEQIDALYDGKQYCEPVNYWNIVVLIFEIISIFTFVSGVIALSVFYFINLK